MRVLEISTGSGYQAAVLAECISSQVSQDDCQVGRAAEPAGSWAIVRCTRESATGTRGWPSAWFDAVVATTTPQGGSSPAPAGSAQGWWPPRRAGGDTQTRIWCGSRGPRKASTASFIAPVRFVPMTGKAQRER